MSRITLEEAMQALKIDRTKLEVETETHAELSAYIDLESIRATDRRDRAKHELETISAKISRETRKRRRRDAEKFSEAELKQEVVLDERYQDVLEEYLTAEKKANEWESISRRFSDRGMRLKDLCALVLSGKYNEIVVKGPQTQEAIYDLLRKQRSRLIKEKDKNAKR